MISKRTLFLFYIFVSVIYLWKGLSSASSFHPRQPANPQINHTNKDETMEKELFRKMLSFPHLSSNVSTKSAANKESIYGRVFLNIAGFSMVLCTIGCIIETTYQAHVHYEAELKEKLVDEPTTDQVQDDGNDDIGSV